MLNGNKLMIEPLEAAIEIHKFFTLHKIPYVLIGGLAVQFWGEPRFTRDVDIMILVPTDKTSEFVQLITNHYESRVSDSLRFARNNRMILIRTSNGYEIDISLGIPGYEEDVMKRAASYKLGSEKVSVCSAEDLIIHKIVAGRPIDFQDLESIICKQNEKLDKKYIMHWLKQFAEALDRPVDKKFEELWNELLEEN